jgi:hypothetical protein
VTALEDALVDLGGHLDAPSGDALALRVGARIRARRAPHARRRLALVFALLVVLLLALSLVPAVGEWLGVRGVEVRQEPSPTTVTTAPGPSAGLDVGAPSSRGAAGRRAGFTPLVPSTLGRPSGVWLDTRALAPIVTLTYPDGTLVAEFRAAIGDAPVLRKFGGPDVRIEEVDLGGHRAIWVEGAHQVAVARPGAIYGDRFRLSDSALLVEIGDVTVRVETRRGRGAALAIGRNLVASAGVGRP